MEKDIAFQKISASPASARPSGVFQGTPDAPAQAPAAEPLIRTMKGDIAEAIKRQNESYVSIALAEEKKKKAEAGATVAAKEAPLAATAVPKRRARVFIILVALLIAAVIGLSLKFLAPWIGTVQMPELSLPSFGGYAELATSTVSLPAPVLLLAPSLISAQSEKRFNLSQETPEDIGTATAEEIALNLPLGAVKNFHFTEEGLGADGETESRAVGIGQLLSFAGMEVPDVLARALERDFMAGIFSASDGMAPFLILKVSSSDGGLAGMLLWEKELIRFFGAFFGWKPESAGALDRAMFRDTVILGRDARAVAAADGHGIAYAFADAHTIVIAGSQGALAELLPKAAAGAR